MENQAEYARRVSGSSATVPGHIGHQPSNALEAMIERLKATADQTAKPRDRLDRIVTRAFGEGVPAGEKADKPQATGTVAAIIALLDLIGTDLDGAERAVTRLDQLT